MKIYVCLLVFVAGVTVVLASGYSGEHQSAAPPVPILERQMPPTDLEEVTTVNALTATLNNAKIPGGIVLAPSCEEQPKRTVKPRDKSLRGVLNAIVAVDPQYRWQVKNGVVNFAPQVNYAPLLNFRITKFAASDVESPREALNQLLRLPEVQAGMARLNAGLMVFRGGLGSYDPQESDGEKTRKFTAECENCTFQESLNAIARAHGSAVWYYSQNQCGAEPILSIGFLVQ